MTDVGIPDEKSQHSVPVNTFLAGPDPSKLTTENLLREVNHLRELLESQTANLQKELTTFKVTYEARHKEILDVAVAHVKELTDSRFTSTQTHLAEMEQRYEQRYVAQTEAVSAAFEAQQAATQAALAAADKAVQSALSAADKAVGKAETLNEKRFETISESAAITSALSDLAHELQERISALDRITDAKFITFRTLIDSQADKVALALASADQAVGKAESLNEKRFETVNVHSSEISNMSDRLERLSESVRGAVDLTDAKFVTFRTLVDSEAEKVGLALAASDKAVSKAEAANEKRFESINEFRAQLNDQAGSFMPRSEARAIIDALSARMDESVKNTTSQIADLKSYRDSAQGGQAGNKQMVAYIFGSIAAISGLLGIAVAIFTNAVK